MPNKTNNQIQSAALGQPPAGRFAYAATSSPPGIAGIAVIRMSGRSVFDIADEVFAIEYPMVRTVAEMEEYTCAYGRVFHPVTKETIDQAILTKFVMPHSYTGEDTIEISCHGGITVRENILAALYAAGARPAEPGEFTRNAFLNGKLDLAQAEAVMDLISSTARKAGSEAIKQLQGNLSNQIGKLTSKIYQALSTVELILEFPEHEETRDAMDRLQLLVETVNLEVDSLIQSFRKGRVLKEGFKVVIAGKPNAGKSSMLNTLSGYDRAIVTEIPGTTRDTIEETVEIDGLPVRLIDTAGLRHSDDTVEILGIDKAREAINGADLVLWVFDTIEVNPASFTGEDQLLNDIMHQNQTVEFAFIFSKSDINPMDQNLEKLRAAFPSIDILQFSSVTEDGLDDVRNLIKRIYDKRGSISSEEVIVTNARHVHALEKTKLNLEMALTGFREHLPLDIVSGTLRGAAESIAEITGDQVSEKIIDEIFSRFCIGK